MICKNCGKELTESSTFCSECGMQQDVQEAVPNLSATQSSSSGASVVPVSYTHLDVYKRQVFKHS